MTASDRPTPRTDAAISLCEPWTLPTHHEAREKFRQLGDEMRKLEREIAASDVDELISITLDGSTHTRKASEWLMLARRDLGIGAAPAPAGVATIPGKTAAQSLADQQTAPAMPSTATAMPEEHHDIVVARQLADPDSVLRTVIDAHDALRARCGELVEENSWRRIEMKAVWDYLQLKSPWSESNDMPWADELTCGIDLLLQRAEQAESESSRLRQELEDAVSDYKRVSAILTDTDAAGWKERAEQAERDRDLLASAVRDSFIPCTCARNMDWKRDPTALHEAHCLRTKHAAAIDAAKEGK